MARVLVAEDDRDAGMLLQLVLRKAGHEVRLVATGRAVLDACATETPDVLLLDVTMPEMNGYEVARALKREPATAGVAVIFVTGSDDPLQRAAGLTLGANDYITKPFHRDELLARLEVALRLKREADELKASNTRLAELAATDPLTGLYSRPHLERRIREEIARADRYRTPLSCILVALDQLAALSERRGPATGDRALRMVAGALRDSIRTSDVVGRFGRAEFLIIAPATSLSAALLAAERIRVWVAAQAVILGSEAASLTISAGAAAHGPGGTVSSLIDASAQALESARAAGGNRVAPANRPDHA